ncbi:imelysin family protein [Psychromonas sp. Urea-02u-13]|uniref:imelysin family protein n=1 Tax=Psychromonas sp. Urea-02u-13 TaxID=2058326 RepID=UPI000C31BF1F|nr:imelysin family protein [Psychromonas sp. Urea-02u-13]PKG40395.1 iron-regulated protein [Psychromonas sp. Urea-02u-13]
MFSSTGFKTSSFSKKALSIALASALSFTSAVAIASFADNQQHRGVATSDVTIEQVKANYVTMAYAAYDDSYLTAKTLQKSIEAFLASPSEATLNSAKEAYKLARAPYQQSEIMRWDTDITINADLAKKGGLGSVDDWEGQVNAWPLDEQAIDYVQGNKNAGIINQKNGEQITAEYLVKQNGVGGEANVTTGYHAIEFLLWGQDLNGTKAGAGERSFNDFQTDKSGLCSASNCDRRRDYLNVSTELLVDDLQAMKLEWNEPAATTAGTLAHNFLNSDDAIRYMLFALKSMATDELAAARMNEGLEGVDPEQEHDCFSDLSHIAIYHNFQGIRNAFYGGYQSIDGKIVQGASLADLINQKDKKLFNEFDSAFQAIEKNMSKVLNAGEQTNNPIRFDQIIGQADSAPEKKAALDAVYQLVSLSSSFDKVEALLSIEALTLSGTGD